MTKRHGVLLNATSQPRWRLGVWQIFDPWVNPHLQLLQGYAVPKITRPVTIEFHFRRVVQRLVRSLARLYKRVREWNHFLEAGGLASARPELAFDIPEEGGIAADSVFHYLNLFIDDLARVVPLILANDGTEAKELDGFSMLKRMLNGTKKGTHTFNWKRCASLFSERRLCGSIISCFSWRPFDFLRTGLGGSRSP